MNGSRDGDSVSLTLTYSEAFVLAEMLWRWENAGGTPQWPHTEDQAEERLLYDLSTTFEPLIDEILSPKYGDALARARSQVRDGINWV
jgi:hypothetical protein